MNSSINAAMAAYGNVAKLTGQDIGGGLGLPTGGAGGGDFAKMLAESLQGVAEAGQRSDQLSMDIVNGKASIVDVVTAISQTEMAVESMVSVRDRVISAYEEIMRMPI